MLGNNGLNDAGDLLISLHFLVDLLEGTGLDLSVGLVLYLIPKGGLDEGFHEGLVVDSGLFIMDVLNAS